MKRLFSRSCLFVALSVCATTVAAQEPGGPGTLSEDPQTREAGPGTIARSGSLSRMFSWAETRIDDASAPRDGWYPALGGMIPGAGLAAGPGFRHRLFGDSAVLDASAAVSWRRYQTMQSRITWPRLLDGHLALGGQVRFEDFTQINFFGIGGSSLKNQQTDYRLEDVDAFGFATLRANARVSITGRAGVLRRVGIRPGTSTLHPSIGDLFDETAAPGLTQQPNYLHADVAIDVDTRDAPGYSSRGGRYQVSMAMFDDQDFARYSFRRFDADAVQYVPLGRSVIAVRGRIALSQTGTGQEVPFYLLPTLGGSDSLRGYLDYRFRDRNLLLLGAEYRWPILRRIDVALFYDGGAVAATAGVLTRRLFSDYGAGIRMHTATRTLVRLDVARGEEGARVLLSLSAPLSLPNRTSARYVP
jgi:outer membrane protein assembly factor BamA